MALKDYKKATNPEIGQDYTYTTTGLSYSNFGDMSPRERQDLFFDMKSAVKIANKTLTTEGKLYNPYQTEHETAVGFNDLPSLTDAYIKNFMPNADKKGIFSNYWEKKKAQYMRETAEKISKDPNWGPQFTNYALPEKSELPDEIKKIGKIANESIYTAKDLADQQKEVLFNNKRQTLISNPDLKPEQLDSAEDRNKQQSEKVNKSLTTNQLFNRQGDVVSEYIAIAGKGGDAVIHEQSRQHVKDLNMQRPFARAMDAEQYIEKIADEQVKQDKQKFEKIGSAVGSFGKAISGFQEGFLQGQRFRRRGRGDI